MKFFSDRLKFKGREWQLTVYHDATVVSSSYTNVMVVYILWCAELRLVEAVEVSTQRVSRTRQPSLHGSVQPRPHHVHLRTTPGDEEAGAGRKRIQGNVQQLRDNKMRTIWQLTLNSPCEAQQFRKLLVYILQSMVWDTISWGFVYRTHIVSAIYVQSLAVTHWTTIGSKESAKAWQETIIMKCIRLNRFDKIV